MYNVNGNYRYIYTKDTRVLGIHYYGWFFLLNTTDFNTISSGWAVGQVIRAGSLFNDTHVVMSTQNAHLIMITN